MAPVKTDKLSPLNFSETRLLSLSLSPTRLSANGKVLIFFRNLSRYIYIYI